MKTSVARGARRLACFLAAGLAWHAACAEVGSAGRVSIVLSDESAPYLEAAQAFISRLAQIHGAAATVSMTTADAVAAGGGAPLKDSGLVVAVGVAAARTALDVPGDAALLGVVIPRQAFDALHCDGPAHAHRRCAAVYFDQPLARQLNLIEAALPDRKRLGVVLGPTSAELLPQLREEAAQRGFTVDQRTIAEADQLYPALQAILPEVDVLWTAPDGVVLTTASARSLLVSAYRFQVPVAAFSEKYVNAGALLAVYSSPAQLGRQAAEMLLPEGGRIGLAPSQYPKYFEVRVNQQVGRSLGLALADEKQLQARLAGMRE